MTPSRRGLFGLFGLFAGALAAPYLGKLPPIAVGGPMAPVALSLSEIVTTTLRSLSATIADDLTRHNPMVDRLSAEAWQ